MSLLFSESPTSPDSTTGSLTGSGSRSRSRSNKMTGKKKTRKRIVVKYISESEDSSSSMLNSETSSSGSEEKDLESESKRRRSSNENGTMKAPSKKKQVLNSDSGEENEYSVEKILDMNLDNKGQKWYHVKWLNYGSSENTWEPEENMVGCQAAIDEYFAMKKKGTSPAKFARLRVRNIASTRKADKKPNKSIKDVVEEIKTSMKNVTGKVKENIDIPSSPSPSESSGRGSGESSEIEAEYIRTPHPANIYYFRVVENGEVSWIYIDTMDALRDSDDDTYYRCVVTDDLTGKQPKLICGATTSVDGNKFCLVQFEGHSYVEVISPDKFFGKFPSFKKFFEIHCPHLFADST